MYLCYNLSSWQMTLPAMQVSHLSNGVSHASSLSTHVILQLSLNNRFHRCCRCVVNIVSRVPKEQQLQAKNCEYNQLSELKAHHGCEIVGCQMSFRGWVCLEIREQPKEQSDTTSAPLACNDCGITCWDFLRSIFQPIEHQDVQQHAFWSVSYWI